MKIMRKKPERVAASRIGAATYCPYTLYLAKKGASVSKDTRRLRQKGVVDHHKWTTKRRRLSRRSGWVVVWIVILLLADLFLL